MGFSDWEQTIEETFIHPLQQFRAKVTSFNEIHNDCMNKCSAILGELLTGSDGQPAFRGSGANALANVIGQFFDTEQQYAGSSEYLIGRLGDASAIYEKAASDLQQRLEQIAAEAGVSGLVADSAGLAVAADVGAVAQGGLDVPWDLVALAATGAALIAGATAIDPDAVRSQDAQTALKLATIEANEEIDEGPMSETIPDLSSDPQRPDGPQGGSNGLLIGLLLCLVVIGGVAYTALNADNGNNNPTASIADDLSQQYGVSLSVVEEIINNNPGLTKDQYALLVQYYKKYGSYPYGVLAVFEGVDQNGKTKIEFVTRGDLAHIREHPDQLQSLSNKELLKRIQELLQMKPDKAVFDKHRGFVDYYYDGIKVDGKYIAVDIRISTTNPGRIISTFERWE